MAQTADDLAQTLKEVWTSDRMQKQMSGGYTTAKDFEVQGALAETEKFMKRQIYTHPNLPANQMYWTSANISSPLFHERKARQAEMMQRFAAKKRGNKPSYRQRQKNRRKAAGR